MELTNKIDLSIATRIKIKEGEVLSLKIGNEILWNRPYLQRTQNLQKSAKSNSIEVPDDIGSIDKFNREFSKYNIFNKLDILYLLASTDASRDVNFNRIDFIKPTRLGTYNGGLSYGLGGIKGNGTNGYFGTSFNPATDATKYTLNDASRGAIVTELFTGGSTTAIDGTSQTNTNSMLFNRGNFFRINQGNAIPTYTIDMRLLGLKILNRISEKKISAITVGTYEEFESDSTAVFNSEQYIFRNGSGSAYGNGRVGLYFMGASITLEESIIIENAYNNYIA